MADQIQSNFAGYGGTGPVTGGVQAPAAATPTETPDYDQMFSAADQKYGLPNGMTKALALAEGNGRITPNAVSPKGARGIMQFMPATAKQYGVKVGDPASEIDGGAHYYSDLLNHFGGDHALATAAWNAGPEPVKKYNGIPPYKETEGFVNKVINFLSPSAQAAEPAAPASAPSNKTPSWSDIIRNPDYKALDADGKEEFRQMYWKEVVAPGLPDDKLDEARAKFDDQTAPSALKKAENFGKDAFLATAQGVVEFPQWVYGLANTVSGGRIDRLTAQIDGEPMSQKFQRTIDFLGAQKSDDLQAKLEDLNQTKGFFESAKKIITQPDVLADNLLQMAPSLLGMAGPARAFGTRAAVKAYDAYMAGASTEEVLSGAAQKAAQAAAMKAAEKAATVSNVVTMGAMGAGQAANSTRAQVLGMSDDDLQKKSDYYRSRIDAGDSPQEARIKTADRAAALSAMIAGPVNGLMTLVTGFGSTLSKASLPGKFVQAATKGPVKGTIAATAGGAAANAGFGAGSQIAENIAVNQTADNTRDLGEGVPQAAGIGAAVGAPLGLGAHAVGHIGRMPSAEEKAGATEVETVPPPTTPPAVTPPPAAPIGPLTRAVAAAGINVLGGHASGAEVLPTIAPGVQGTDVLGKGASGAESLEPTYGQKLAQTGAQMYEPTTKTVTPNKAATEADSGLGHANSPQGRYDQWRVDELNRLNPQLKSKITLNYVEPTDPSIANHNGDGAGDMLGGHNGSSINVVNGKGDGATVSHEIRHAIDMLLGGYQLRNWLASDGNLMSRMVAHLKGERDQGRLDHFSRMTDPEETAQSVLDAYYRNKDGLRAVFPDVVEYLEKMGADKYAHLMRDVPQTLTVTPNNKSEAAPAVAEPATPVAEKATPAKQKAAKPTTFLRLVEEGGGVNRKEAEAQGVDPAYFKEPKYRRVFPAKGGMTFDEGAEHVSQNGFGAEQYSANEFNDMLHSALMGKEPVSRHQQLSDLDATMKAQEAAHYDRPTQDDLAISGYNEDDQPTKDMTDAYLRGRQAMGDDAFENFVEGFTERHAHLSDDEFEDAFNKALDEVIHERTAKAETETAPAHEAGAGGVEAPAQSHPGEEGERAPARAVESGQTADLFGGKNASQQAIHDAELERQKKMAEAPPVESGDGDLFSGRAKQVDIEEAAHEAATSPQNNLPEPTEAQKEAGNYQKGHVNLNGLDISIENPAGSRRRPEWPPLKHHYGYIKGTIGKDKDHIDVFLGPKADDPGKPVFVVDQKNPKTATFDEHKVMLGFDDELSAREGYLANYEKGWKGLGAIHQLSLDQFKDWLKNGNTTKPAAEKTATVPWEDETTSRIPTSRAFGELAGKHKVVLSGSKNGFLAEEGHGDTAEEAKRNAVANWNRAQEKRAQMRKGVAAPEQAGAETKQLVSFLRETIESAIDDGESNAALLPTRNIAAFENVLKEQGWEPEPKKKGTDWKKGDATLFIRSQGDLANPIVQWSVHGAETGEEAVPTPKRAPEYGTTNKVFTKDAADAARALLKKKLGQVNAGLDPEMMHAGITLAGYHVEAGARKFGAFSKAMIEDLGEAVRPYLKAWYLAVRNWPGFNSEGMHTEAEIGLMEKHIAKYDDALGPREAPAVEPPAADVAKTLQGVGLRVHQTKTNNGKDVWEVSGDTRTQKDMLKSLGGRWYGPKKVWSFYDGDPSEKIARKLGIKTEAPAAETVPKDLDYADYIADHFLNGGKFSSIAEASKTLGDLMMKKVEPGTLAAKQADEIIEAGAVRAARKTVEEARGKGESDADIYKRLTDLHERMPNLNVRTSSSVANQAYSTPLPIAFVASRLAGIDRDTVVYEPSAGNGALLIEADPKRAIVNELDKSRAGELRAQGFDPTEHDATTYVPAQLADVVIANPPFGAVQEHGVSKRFNINEQYSTTDIDHAIALKALSDLKDDGRAVLILGGIKAEDNAVRSDGYNGKSKRAFYYTLYRDYNVTDHFTIDGDLYAKQGAAWPVDVVTINGRGKSARALPAADVPRIIHSYDELGEVLKNEPVRLGAEGERSIPESGSDLGAGGPETRPGDLPVAAGEPGAEARESGTGQEGSPEPSGDLAGGIEPAGESAVPRVRRGRNRPEQPGGAGAPVVPESTGETAGGRNGERPGGEAGAGEHGSGELVNGPDATAPRRQQLKEAQVTDTQAPYVPASGIDNIGTLVPVNMRTAISDSLDKLKSDVGDIDRYVANKLEYPIEDLPKYLSAEQVDALALALHNIERGDGFIIGDQTGIGKGRVVASIIRYALKLDKTPIFVTEKPNLYADMARDLADIGMGDVKPFMTNAGETVPLDDAGTKVLKTQDSKTHNALMQEMIADGDLKGHDVIFTTYNQMQTVKGKRTARQDFIDHFARGGVVIFDESHNAGGSEAKTFGGKEAVGKLDRAKFARDIAGKAHGVFYSSATYAKRPSVMDLYFKTDMKLAVKKISELANAISSGGVPLQQVVAAMLAKAGQYIRRERSFAGVDYLTKVAPVNRQAAEDAAAAMRAINVFDGAKKAGISEIKERLKKEARGVVADGSVGQAGVSSTNFTSVMHNLVDQLLLAMKIQPAIDTAAEALKRGEKPVITVANTMGSFIEQYVADHGLNPGDAVGLSFRDLLLRYLEKSREILEGNAFGQKTRRRLSDEELGPIGRASYNSAKSLIEGISFDVPISPIDRLKQELKAKGYRVGEITGRQHTINYAGHEPTYEIRPGKETSIAGRRRTITAFNNGDLDVMILNQAGATGLSLHASEKFKDRNMRHMIIAQPEKNIDTHMQMLGRVHRTGQVVVPTYTQLVADIPAEKRPAAILAKKMASLNANTTASRESAVTAKDVVDFMNEYGDEVAASLMEDNPEMHAQLGTPIKYNEDGNGLEREGAIRKLTGRIPMLPVADQEKLYDMIENDYQDMLARMDAIGQNSLEAKTLDLDAKTLKKHQIFKGSSEKASPFAEGAYAEDVDMKRQGRPYTSAQVLKLLRTETKAGDGAGLPEIRAKARESNDAVREEYLDKFDRYLGGFHEIEPEQQKNFDFQRSRFTDFLNNFTVGDEVKIGGEEGAGMLPGVITKIERKGTTKNPIAPGSWRVSVALADAARHVTVPLSKLGFAEEGGERSYTAKLSIVPDHGILPQFDHAQSVSRERRTIVTGNLLSGFSTFGKGQIVHFNDHEGNVRQGILMPANFSLGEAMGAKPVVLKPEQASAFLRRSGTREVNSENGAVSIQKGWRDDYEIKVPSSKDRGGKYFLDQRLLNALGTEFVKRGNHMVAEIEPDRLNDVLRTLHDDLEEPMQVNNADHKDEARRLTGEKLPQTSSDTKFSLDLGQRKEAPSAHGIETEEETPAEKTLREAVEHAVGKTLEKGAFTDAGVPDAFRGVAQAVKDIFGKDVVFFRNNIPDTISFGGLATRKDQTKLYVNVDHPKPFVFTTGHELLHMLRKDRPDIYNKLYQVALKNFEPDMVKNYGDFLKQFKEKQGLAREPDANMIHEEMLANFAGDNFARPVFWSKLAEAEPNVFIRVARAVFDYLKSLIARGKLHGRAHGYNSADYFKNLEEMRDAIGNAMKEYAEHNRIQQRTESMKNGPERAVSVSDVSFSPEEELRRGYGRSRESLFNKAARIPVQALGIDKLTSKAWELFKQGAGKVIPEKVKAGMASDYGLPQDVKDKRAVMQAHIRGGFRDVEEKTLPSFGDLTRDESRALYELGNTNDPADIERIKQSLKPESVQALDSVKQTIDDLSQEAVRLGQLPLEAYERNRMAYFHRSYTKWDVVPQVGRETGTARSRAIHILGEQYKGRGLLDAVKQDKMKNVAPEFWRRKEQSGKADIFLKGEKFIKFEKRSNRGEGVGTLPGMEDSDQLGRVQETHYWPASEPIPAKYGDWHRDAGTWEVRGTKGDKVLLWRDFTKEERQKMGEIDEVKYAVAKTMHQMIHDVEVGRYLEYIANQHAMPDPEDLPAGAKIAEASESMRRTFGKDEWVKVPEANVAGTSTKKYGKLAGLYVPGPIWNDIRQTVNRKYAPLGETYATVLKAWKVSKTALSPTVHMNNVMANFVMADWHDVLARHVLQALDHMVHNDRPESKALIRAFEDNGGTEGMYVISDIQRKQLEPLIEQLRKDIDKGDEQSGLINASSLVQLLSQGKISEAMAAAGDSKVAGVVKKAGRLMLDTYQNEDAVFRLAAFLKAKEEGKSDLEAGRFARDSFLDYQINAPWVQMMRATAFPFISFFYRAAPMMLDTYANKPWKMLKLAAVLGSLNAIGYAMSGGNQEQERKLLPDEKSGQVLGFMGPKLLRMPWNDSQGNPVFLDIRRFIPVGDIFDMGQTNAAVPILPVAVPGGPLATMAELAFNRSQFTGKDITQDTDTPKEKAEKVFMHLYQSFMPNILLAPGTYAYQSAVNAGTGKTDAFGREQSLPGAIASGMGIKIGAYPRDVALLNLRGEYMHNVSEIDKNIQSLKRQYQMHALTPEEFQEKVMYQMQKKRELANQLREKVSP